MRFIVSIYLACLIIWIGVRVIQLAVKRRAELLSVHTVFLGGFIIFQLTSSILGLAFNIYGNLEPDDKTVTPMIFAFMATLFLILFEWSYARDWGVLRYVRGIGKGDWDGAAGGWFALSLVLLGLGALMKTVLMWIPLFGILSSQAGAGVLTASAATAAWAWSRDFRNPIYIGLAFAILLLALTAVSYQSFGRRGTIGVPLGFGWAIYYAYWRRFPLHTLIRKVTIFGFIGLFFLTVYTATRRGGGAYENQSLGDRLTRITELNLEDITGGMTSVLTGQNAGPLSMWAIETYGSAYPYVFMHQVKFLFAMPIPRALWANKPYPLAKDMVHDGAIRRKGSGDVFNVGPGIIGHVAHDFPWLALPFYAIVMGLIVRALDERTMTALHRPFIVIPCGCALGQTIAFSRGEAALFLWNGLMAFVGALYGMRISGFIAMFFGAMYQTDPEEAWDPLFPDDDWDDDDVPTAAGSEQLA